MNTLYENQKGNALWFVLLGVVLLGALTAVVSRTGSHVSQTGGIEKYRIQATEVLRYTKSIETAVQQMILNGVSENDIDFVAISVAHDNPNCNETRCEVFHREGGGIAYKEAKIVLGDSSFSKNWLISTGNRIGGLGCDDAVDSCRELVMLLKAVPEALCLQINAVMNITNPSGALPSQEYVEEGDAFTGAYNVNAQNYILGGTDAVKESPQVMGKNAGCVNEYGDGQDNNFFYQVLIVR